MAASVPSHLLHTTSIFSFFATLKLNPNNFCPEKLKERSSLEVQYI